MLPIYILLGLTLVFASLSVVLLLRLGKQKHAHTASQKEIEELREQVDKMNKELPEAMGRAVRENVVSLGKLLLDQQRDAQKNMQDRIGLMEQGVQNRLAANRDAMTQTLTAMDKKLVDAMQTTENRLMTMEQTSEQKLENVRKTVGDQLGVLREDNNKRLEQMQQVVDEKLQKTLESKMNESFKLVSERLEKVYEGLGEMQTIAGSGGDLKKVLSGVKTRGILGEIQLGAILSEILTPDQYDTEVPTFPRSTNRVEYAVKLPGLEDGKHIYLPIDSKFPADAYHALQVAYESADQAAIAETRKLLTATIKQSARDIQTKYVKPPYTTNFGIMFLPFEGLYAEVVNLGLIEPLSQNYHINVCGPSTMAAMLNTLQMGFRTLAIQKHSNEVWTVLGAVKTEFASFAKVLEDTRTRLRQADDELDKLVGVRTRKINSRLRGVESLSAETAQGVLDVPEADDTDV